MFSALKAAQLEATLPDLVHAHSTFLSVAKTDSPSELQVRNLGGSKTQESLAVSWTQAGRGIVEFVFVFGDIDANASRRGFSYPSSHGHVLPPSLTPPGVMELMDFSEWLDESMGSFLKIAKHNKILVDPDDCTLYQKMLDGSETEESRLSCWGGLADSRELDVQCLTYLMDAFPPPILAQQPTGWVPTVSYNVQIFARPEPGSTLAAFDFQTRIARDGLLICDGHAWSARGEILACSRQSARIWVPKQE